MVVEIDIHADTLCPWCYLEKKSLDKAIEKYQEQHPDVRFDVRWRPFYLYPMLKEGCDKETLYKSNMAPATFTTYLSRIQSAASSHNTTISLLTGRTGPSQLSHKLISLALTQRGPAAQAKVVEAVFKGYFSDGRDIADVEWLVELGCDVGLDGETVREALECEKMAREVDDEVRRAAAEKDVRAVPCVTVQGRFRVGGYQESQVFERLFDKIREERAR